MIFEKSRFPPKPDIQTGEHSDRHTYRHTLVIKELLKNIAFFLRNV